MNRITEMEITWKVTVGRGRGREGEKVPGISSINGRYKIDKGKLRIIWEMEKTKNLYDQWT